MTGAEFITYVQLKLNRIDTSSYEDVRPEEILFFAHEALKKMTLDFDMGKYSQFTDRETLLNYLASITKSSAEVVLSVNKVALPQLLKIKGMSVFVRTNLSGSEETGWQVGKIEDNVENSDKEYNPFTRSYPDKPGYTLLNGVIDFSNDLGFTCEKIRYDYLVFPAVITETSNLTFPFMMELEDSTVTLILENLESQRLQSQMAISKS